jgi:hypothetical protein
LALATLEAALVSVNMTALQLKKRGQLDRASLARVALQTHSQGWFPSASFSD